MHSPDQMAHCTSQNARRPRHWSTPSCARTRHARTHRAPSPPSTEPSPGPRVASYVTASTRGTTQTCSPARPSPAAAVLVDAARHDRTDVADRQTHLGTYPTDHAHPGDHQDTRNTMPPSPSALAHCTCTSTIRHCRPTVELARL